MTIAVSGRAKQLCRDLRSLAARLSLLLMVASCQQEQGLLVLEGATMGTGFQVLLADPVEEIVLEELHQQMTHELAEIDRQMSTWRDDSEIARFNALQDDRWMPISERFCQVLSTAVTLSAATDNALDITLGPLSYAWGFQSDRSPRIPAPEEIQQLLSVAGMHQFEVDTQRSAVRKLSPALALDVSSLAKGFAVDQLSQILRDAGIEHFLVDIGGELRAAGQRPDGTPWRVAIEGPLAGGQQAQTLVALSEEAIATSGDYRNYREINGQHFSHLLDPRTGTPATHGTSSVTVIAATAMTADALATAWSVVPRMQAIDQADAMGIATFIVERRPDGFVTHTSNVFRKRLQEGLAAACDTNGQCDPLARHQTVQ